MVTWPSREQKPTCTDVLLILVFVWSFAICLFPQRQAGLWLGKEEEDLEFGKAGLRTLKCCSVRPSICLCRVASLCLWILCLKINQTESRKKRNIVQKQVGLQNTALPGKKEKEEIVWTCVGVCEGATAPRKSRGAEEVLLYLQLLKSLPAIATDSARTSDNSEPQQACSAVVKNSAQTFASVWVELGKLAV